METKIAFEIQAANGIVRFTKVAKICTHELGANLNVKMVEGSPRVLSLGRLCDELGSSCSWQP